MASSSGPGDFAWAFGSGGAADVNSLRSGPLSPAMLAGPAQYSTSNGNPAGGPGAHHGGPGSGYDVMRTGLTPDVNRTGLTPLIGGPTSFPPPSPNTAAFIAMVTNQNNAAAGQSGSGVASPATITPGTFSAITGALLNNSNGNNGENGESTSPTNTHNPHHNPHPHPLSMSHVPDGSADMNDDAAHTAANGLFLLSQAHHELTKREEQQQQQQQQQQLAAQRQAQQQEFQAAQTRSASSKDRSNSNAYAPSTKRRTAATSNDSNKRARASTRAASSRSGGRRKKSEDISSNDDEDDDQDEVDNDGGSDDEELEAAAGVGNFNAKGHGSSSTPTKKPETEEEKRKNFLERNRQGSYFFRRLYSTDTRIPTLSFRTHLDVVGNSLRASPPMPHSSSLVCCDVHSFCSRRSLVAHSGS